MSSASRIAQAEQARLAAEAAVPYACGTVLAKRWQLDRLMVMSSRSWVYRAADLQLSSADKPAMVAVKISRRMATGAADVQGKMVRRISHPGVVSVLERGVAPLGHRYIVMELITGGALSAHVGMRWPVKRATRLIGALAEAVQAAHSAGVVHCDLKPQNVLLTSAGRAKLIDFDLAVHEDDAPEAEARGNLAFMAPEQYRAERGSLTPQADVYALGGLLHLLLTGQPPHGSDKASIEAAHAAGRAPSFSGCPSALAAIGRKAMAPDRRDRYATAQELARDLAAWRTNRPIEWQRPGPIRLATLWTIRNPALAVGIGALAIGIAAVFAGWEAMKAQQRALESTSNMMVIDQAWAKIEANRRMQREQLGALLQAMAAAEPPGENGLTGDALLLRQERILTWLGQQTEDLEANQPTLGAEQRVEVMGKLIARLEQRGQSDSVSALVARCVLATAQIELQRPAVAWVTLQRAEKTAARLAPTDLTRQTYDALHGLVRLDLSPADEIAAHRRSVSRHLSVLRASQGPPAVIRLLEARLGIEPTGPSTTPPSPPAQPPPLPPLAPLNPPAAPVAPEPAKPDNQVPILPAGTEVQPMKPAGGAIMPSWTVTPDGATP
ncbi:MAG: serine/threonine protein kinase [Phycisphaerales bacterium]|nr:serine/threonine protein kinase [Phycisphaerales bacterium]